MAIAQAVANSFKKEILEGTRFTIWWRYFQISIIRQFKQTYQLQQHLSQQVENMEIVVSTLQVEVY